MFVGWSGVANLANTEPATAIQTVADTEFLYPPGWGVAGNTVVATYLNLYPLTLFLDGSQGYWFDNNDPSTMFQDSAGTTPVTTVEQFVGLQLDKSQGLVLGPDVVVNGTFETDSDWTKGTGWTINTVTKTAVKSSGTASALTQVLPTTAGKWYKVSASIGSFFGVTTVSIGTSGTSRTVSSTSSVVDFYLLAGTGTQTLSFSADASVLGFVDNVTVRELPGNHRYQSTSGSRPRWSKRVNLLEKTEQFDDAYWTKTRSSITANATTAPNGTLTADKLVENTDTNTHFVIRTATTVSNVQYVASVYVKADTRDFVQLRVETPVEFYSVNVNLLTGASSIFSFGTTTGFSASVTDEGSGWWRIDVSVKYNSSTLDVRIALASALGTTSYTGDGTSGIFIWGADLRPANQATGTIPLYQRVDTSSVYDTNGFPGYLVADGSDDWMQTNSIDFSGTDKVTLCAGVRKLSDAAQGALTELSASIASNNGAFLLAAPDGATNTYGWDSKGTTQVDAVASSLVAPLTNVVTGIGDIGGDSAIIRVNGAVADTETGDQGTGNYGNYPVYFFRRGGTTLTFNGYEYSNIAVGKLLTDSQLASLEQYMTEKTRP